MKAISIALSLLIASFAVANEASSIDNVESIIAEDELEFAEEKTNLRRLQSGPNAAKRMATWKKVHNDMRKKYHVQYGGEFVPIKWNMELKNEAEAWAKELVSNCVNRLPGSTKNPNNYGVNSAMNSKSSIFRSPVAIMKMWENKLPLGYPANSVMTQVLWAKTEYVGCADAASPGSSANKCSASVCFYAKAGNCAFKRFGGTGNWTQAVINGPACTNVCPSTVAPEDC